MSLFAAFSFGDALLTVVEVALFIAWICLLVYVLADVFASHDLSGLAKTLWVIGIFIFPLLGTLLYVLLRGGDMHRRAELARAAGVLGGGLLSDELERLSALHERGRISDAEYERAKDRSLDAAASS